MHEFKSFAFLEPVDVQYELDSVVIDTVIGEVNKDNYNDFSIGGAYYGDLNNWSYSADGYLFLTGYRSGDLNVGAQFTRYLFDKRFFVTLGGRLKRMVPSYFISNYGSSHFKWRNDFSRINQTSGSFIIGNDDDFRLNVSLHLISGNIHFNKDGYPQQTNTEILTATADLYKKFTWGPVNQTYEILLQKGAENIINIPTVALRNSTWYENKLFKEVLLLRVGVNFYYFTPYYADSFMPSTAVFHNQQEQDIGNYPYLDGFIDFKLKRTRFTLQYTNALSELLPEANYFMAYRNPAFGGRFKFGLAWTFYD